MDRELFFTTLDFFMKTIEAKEAEIVQAGATVNSARLEAQMLHLQRRLHLEFCYLATFADGSSEAR